MKIAVTAASGKLGSEVVKACIKLAGSENVIGLARTPANARHLGIEIHPGDYSKRSELVKSLQLIDALLLVSGNESPDKRIDQHRNVIQAAKKAGVKKIVYTSIQGPEEKVAFSEVVKSNRQTEQDVCNSGLEWVIGRNGIYIEPDVEYIESYKKAGFISNCAGEGKCGYTTREELGAAYAQMLVDKKHNGKIYNLHGEAITQSQLADYLNKAFKTNLVYKFVSMEEYRNERIAELGEFYGDIIAGIYDGINKGAFNNPSQFSEAAGREHISWNEYFSSL